MSEDIKTTGTVSRRDAIKKGAIAGGALIWTAPLLSQAPAYAAAVSTPPCAPRVISTTVSYQDRSTTQTDFVTVTIGFEELCNCSVEFANWAGAFNSNPLTGDLLPPTSDQVAVFRLTAGGDFPAGTFEFDTDIYACCNNVVTGATHVHVVDNYVGSGGLGNPTFTLSPSAAALTCP